MDELPKREMQEILDHIYQGQKIAAVNLYRDLRNCSLLDAKNFVDQLESDLREKNPQEFSTTSNGCANILIVAACSSLAVWSLASFLSRL